MISCLESKIIKCIVAETRMVIARGWWEGEIRRCWLKGTEFQLYILDSVSVIYDESVLGI